MDSYSIDTMMKWSFIHSSNLFIKMSTIV